MPSSDHRFYADLPVFGSVEPVMRQENYRALPDDWVVCLCDVRGSTAAIRDGRYKEVNSLGAAAITAVLNAVGSVEVPFSFEGDGCVVCVPREHADASRAALARVRQIARESFALDLRAAVVECSTLRQAGAGVFVARYRVSRDYVQALFAGGGIALADRLIKDPATAGWYLVPEDTRPHGSLDGFECRWKDVPSRHGETVSLMVRVVEPDPQAAIVRYREVVDAVRAIYGEDDACHPVAVPGLKLSLSDRPLRIEAALRATRRGSFGRWLAVQSVRIAVVLGKVFMKLRVRTGETDWGSYKEALVRNSDVRKFSDVYRHILAGDSAQRHALEVWLEQRYQDGWLVYGLHVSDRAQLNCLVFDYAGRHLHFVDGADGGLFLAAKAFKEREARLSA